MARRYKRDKRGRFAPKGYSGQTSGTGSRLKGDGKKRAGGGTVVSSTKMSGTPSNTISKSSTKRKVNANSPGRLSKDERIVRDVMGNKKLRSDKQRRAEMVKRGMDANSDFVKIAASARAKSANNARATGRLTKPAPQSNIRRTDARLGPNNNIKPGPKSPRTKFNKAVDRAIKAGKDLKGSSEKLRDARKKADALRSKFLKQDKGRMKKAFDKPSVTDKRSRDYLGRLTKEGKRQDPGTGGKKSRKRKKP